MDDPESNFVDKSRGFIMMTAKPVATVLAFVIPPLRIAQLGATALTVQTALAIAGEALSVQMTGTSFQDTARNCTFQSDMDTGACLTSAGMTAFAGWSALASMKTVNTITRAAMINEGRSVGAVSKWLANSRASFLVNPGDRVAIQAAALRSGALPATSENIALVEQAATKVFSTQVPNAVAERARNALGTLVFGSQAAQQCGSSGINADCLLSVGLTGISFARTVLPTTVVTSPTSTGGKTILRADQIVNGGLAVTACAAAAGGEANWDHCVTASMMAGMSFGHEAVAQAREGGGPKLLILTPFQEKALALSDLAKIDGLKEFTNLNVTTLSTGETVRFGESATARSSVLERLSLATIESGKTIAQAQALISEFDKLPKEKQTLAERNATAARDAWKNLLTDNGELRPGLNPNEVNAARASLTQAQELLTYERQLTTDPRTAGAKARDAIARFFGREPKVVSDYNTVRKAYLEVSINAEAKPLEYEVARQNLERAQRAIERTSWTRGQLEYARQLDVKREELAKIQDGASLIQLRIDLLERPELIAEARTRQQTVVKEASETLADLVTKKANPEVIDVARKGLARAQDMMTSIEEAARLNTVIKSPAERFTVIANETSKLTPSIAS